jgi:hypothetical protein
LLRPVVFSCQGKEGKKEGRREGRGGSRRGRDAWKKNGRDWRDEEEIRGERLEVTLSPQSDIPKFGSVKYFWYPFLMSHSIPTDPGGSPE